MKNGYLNKGQAQARQIIDNLRTLALESQEAGLEGLRVAGEMEVFLDNVKTEELLRYEEALGKQLPPNICGLCLYNALRLDKELFARANKSHGHPIFKGIAVTTVWKEVAVMKPDRGRS